MKKYLLLVLLSGLFACTPNRTKLPAGYDLADSAVDLQEDPAYGPATTPSGDEKDKAADEVRNDSIPTGDNPLEIPAPLKDRPSLILHREGYTTSYNPSTLLPNWVAWHLTAAHASGSAKRKGIDFQEDDDVPEPRATNQDYVRSGYDRGHICPAGDNKWSQTAMEQSFLMTNICPQDPNLNRGDWNEMEVQCRRWAEKYGDIYIVAGPIFYKGRHKKIGRNKVTVPEAFFKVVLCMRGEPKAIGFIYKNNAGNRPKDAYVNSVDDVERITGIDFFPALPDKLENEVEKEHDLADW